MEVLYIVANRQYSNFSFVALWNVYTVLSILIQLF